MELLVELLDRMGDDLSIVNAARVSFAKQTARMDSGALNHNDIGLINYLMANRHGTPFEMVQFTFRVTCPIFVAREWQRHRIGSYNEVSTRYVEPTLAAYLPPHEDMRTQTGKPGHYVMEPMHPETAAHACEVMAEAYLEAYEYYQRLLRIGAAKEVARNVLPLAHFTQFIWSVNLRSLFNFLSLRTHHTALLEIRKCAEQVLELAIPIAPEAFNAWMKNGRVVP